jgi:catechol 2,3-dioxygenase-like lactoylglutathione lyase family enzyme
MPKMLAAYPISDENVLALPVRSPDAAAEFYRNVLGFSVLQSTTDAALVERDGVRVGLQRQIDHDPGKAGSLAIEVDDLEALHSELQRLGGAPGEFGVDEWNGRRHRTFFVREDVDGYCFCFYRQL